MTTAYTSLLGLALPVTGELSGTWGDTVNNSITSLLDSAIAGTTTLSSDADVTLTTTTGASNTSRQAILLCSGARTVLRTITAPAQSKIYTVINATTGGFSVKLVGAGPTTGLTIPNGASAVVAWNGSDFIEIGSATVGNFTVNGTLTVTGTSTLTGAATLTAGATIQGLTVGKGAGAVATNTAVGLSALSTNTTGSSNSAFGWQAMLNNSTGANNTAVGRNSLRDTTGDNNTAVGYFAAYQNTSGASNTAIGRDALQANTTASNNTAVGYQAGYANTTGVRNSAFGDSSLRSNTTANNNNAFGYLSLYTNTTGTANAAFGTEALFSNTTGLYNTAVGYQAGYSSTTAQLQACFGYQAGYGSTGSSNTFIGNQAGVSMTSGAKNTILGAYNGNQGGLDIRTASNYIVLSDGDGTIGLSTTFNSSIALNGAVPQSGTGITFPASQNSSSNANTLDDYEEGTFTPTCTLTTPGTSSTGSQVGVYTKIGNLVTATGRLTFTKGTGSGDLVLGGLPFTSINTATYQTTGALSLDTFGVTGKIYQIILVNNTTVPNLNSITQAGGAAAAAGATDFGASGAAIRYMFSYQV